MPDLEDIFGNVAVEDVYAQLVNDMPAPPTGGTWETREGSATHANLYPWALEEIRLRDFARDVASNLFLWWSTGTALDAHAAEFGIVRQGARPATVTVTFVGTESTIIPAGTIVASASEDGAEVGGVEFQTTVSGTISGGFVDIACECLEDGAVGNVAAGSITILSTPIVGVTGVDNESAAINGSDDEGDEELRTRAIVRASKRPNGGNRDFYVAIALDEPTVGDGYVQDLWNTIGPGGIGQSGVGSARLVLVGDQAAYVDPTTIDRLQSLIDPTVQVLAHFESPEIWSITTGAAGSAEQTAGEIVEGGGSWRIHPALSATTTITRTLTQPINLSGFSASTDEFWLEIIRTTAQANFSILRVQLEDATGANIARRDIPNAQIATGRIVWTNADWTAAAGTVAAALAAVKVMRIHVVSTASGSADVTVDGLRARNKAGGRGTGLANIGIQVTVRSARYQAIDYQATVTLDTGVSLVAITADLNASVAAYLESLIPGSMVRVTGVANAIHDTIGVIDYSNVQIRVAGGAFAATNIQLDPDEKAKFGAATLS